MSQRDIVWLDLCTSFRDVYLREYRGAYTAFQHLSHPDSQKPQLLALIGGQEKSSFINKAFSLSSIENHKKILLHTVPSHFTSQTPLILVDCELHNALVPSTIIGSKRVTGAIETHSLKWLRNLPRIMGASSLPHLVYTKLVLPFSTVVGIFASDFGGTRNVTTFLASWINLRNHFPISPSSTFARVLIFVPPKECVDEKLATKKFIQEIRRKIIEDQGPSGSLGDKSLSDVEFERLLSESVFELRVLALPHINTPQFDTFAARLLCESEEVHELRRGWKVAYSARHCQKFLELACRHFAESIVLPFNFVHASRIATPIPPNFSSHIARFVTGVSGEQDIISTTIASALHVDSAPPGAHTFDRSLVYETLYSDIVQNALGENNNQIISEIKTKFCAQKDSTNAAWLHKQQLQCFSTVWKETLSKLTCFACLARGTFFDLPCKHSFCDTCIKRYGRCDLEEPWNFDVVDCPLCAEPAQVSFLLKPATAGVRCIVLDNGSQPDFHVLDTLVKAIGLPMEIGEHFDMVNGSGMGSWILLEKFCNFEGLKENLSHQKLKALEQSPVSSRFSSSTSRLRRFEGTFKAVPRWSGRLQSHLKFRSSLNAILGDKTLSECHEGSTKLCVTVTRAKDGATCVLSNYTGDGERSEFYDHVRETKAENDVQLSQCARISLSTKSVGGYRVKQRDVPNEMIEITLAEQNRVWERKGRMPDILLAVGTSISPYEQPKVPGETPEWLDDFRLRKANMPEMSHSVDALLASLFYIELVGLPQLDELGSMFCRFMIRCRILPSLPAYQSLVEKLRKSRARFYFDYQSIPCIDQTLREEAGRGIAFSRCAEMSLPSLQDSMDVKIHGITENSKSISNCPYRLEQLIEDQQLHCVFGNQDHTMKFFGPMKGLQPRLV